MFGWFVCFWRDAGAPELFSFVSSLVAFRETLFIDRCWWVYIRVLSFKMNACKSIHPPTWIDHFFCLSFLIPGSILLMIRLLRKWWAWLVLPCGSVVMLGRTLAMAWYWEMKGSPCDVRISAAKFGHPSKNLVGVLGCFSWMTMDWFEPLNLRQTPLTPRWVFAPSEVFWNRFRLHQAHGY